MPAPENPPVTQSAPDILCLSHLPWDYVYQRPNHLMARAARGHRVFFVQEPYRGKKLQLDVEAIDGRVGETFSGVDYESGVAEGRRRA